MERRSWPWKKKSEKAITLTDSSRAGLPTSSEFQAEKDDAEIEKYIQIKMESYTYFTGLEEQVKSLTEKLFLAESEITAKGNLVKQHTRVAEEAVSGWEKTEAEALSLKQQLESITLLKLSAEDRALHLDNALKECMKEIRNVKEEGEQKLYDAIFSRTKQWEKVKAELEARIIVFEQELQNASTENSVLSKSLQERMSLLQKVSDEKAQVDAEIQVLKKDMQSFEREISSMKYDLHVTYKELEIRNEEKNMCMRSAEVANKHHLEDVKKITKLEAECQRLRGLVRKKLPGPGALAQMKLEVENLGRESEESKLRKASLKSYSPRHMLHSDISHENMQQVHKENEILNARLLAMEEEMKLFKEAFSKRNNELQDSRNICDKQENKICSMNNHALVLSQQNSSLKSTVEFRSVNECNPCSWTSLSEDGFDEAGSFSESCPAAQVPEISHFKIERELEKLNTADSSNYLELMDDFLEMERLACLPTKSSSNISISSKHLETEKVETTSLDQNGSKVYGNRTQDVTSELCDMTMKHATTDKNLPVLEIKSRITSMFNSEAHGATAKKTLEDITHIIQDAEKELHKKEPESVVDNSGDVCSKQGDDLCSKDVCLFDQELKDAISHIIEFILFLSKDDAEIQGSSIDLVNMGKKIEGLSTASVDSVMCSEVILHDFILALSVILWKTNVLRYKDNEGESYGSDCIDKETLLENRVTMLEESLSGSSSLVAHISSSPDFEGSIGGGFQTKNNLPTLSLEDFDKMKLEKEKMGRDLAKCQEMLDQTSLILIETEQQLSDLKTELASCQKSNSLAETQLKCMVESYKILESRKEELEAEISRLHAIVEILDNELKEERDSHLENIAKYKELEEKCERNMKHSVCTLPPNAEEVNTQQEIDIVTATEKLAECQETIYLLGKQLQAMRNPTESQEPSTNPRIQLGDILVDETDAGSNSRRICGSPPLTPQGERATQRSDDESPLSVHVSLAIPPDSESTPFSKSPDSARPQKHKIYGSSPSSSSSGNSASDRSGRVFTRFFTKPKNEK